MIIKIRQSNPSDISFMKEMLYEAVYWRANDERPSIKEGLKLPEISKLLNDWGKTDGDCGAIATIDDETVGAVWFRFWNDNNHSYGYVDRDTPELGIGVHPNFRRKGVGFKLLNWLFDEAKKSSIRQISLSVSLENPAKNLYIDRGFLPLCETKESITMLRTISL